MNVGRERRTDVRMPVSGRCWCEGPEAAQYLKVGDVSTGGIFIDTHFPLSVGETVTVRWDIPGADGEHKALMQVVWKSNGNGDRSRQPGMGLKFLEICDDTAEAIRRHIHSV
jgi:Tfp pilus assembly protein PilZ